MALKTLGQRMAELAQIKKRKQGGETLEQTQVDLARELWADFHDHMMAGGIKIDSEVEGAILKIHTDPGPSLEIEVESENKYWLVEPNTGKQQVDRDTVLDRLAELLGVEVSP